MNVFEAAEQARGRRIKRINDKIWISSLGPGFYLSLEALRATDWVIEDIELVTTITLSYLIDAWNRTVEYTNENDFAGKSQFFSVLAEQLGYGK